MLQIKTIIALTILIFFSSPVTTGLIFTDISLFADFFSFKNSAYWSLYALSAIFLLFILIIINILYFFLVTKDINYSSNSFKIFIASCVTSVCILFWGLSFSGKAEVIPEFYYLFNGILAIFVLTPTYVLIILLNIIFIANVIDIYLKNSYNVWFINIYVLYSIYLTALSIQFYNISA